MPDVSKKTDHELIKKIQKHACNNCFNELFERHKKIYFNVCSYYTRGKSILNYQEIIEDVYYVFSWALQKYDPKKKTKFSTFLYIYSKYYCLNQIKRKNGNNHLVDISDNDLNNMLSSHAYHDINLSINGKSLLNEEVFSLLDKMKDKRIKKIFEMRFYGGVEESKWKNISGSLDMTPQRAYTLFNQGKTYLAKNIER
jgi:RNA polymerase sigma factor (sigma-70 family)